MLILWVDSTTFPDIEIKLLKKNQIKYIQKNIITKTRQIQ